MVLVASCDIRCDRLIFSYRAACVRMCDSIWAVDMSILRSVLQVDTSVFEENEENDELWSSDSD